jgi:anionic cell wall polymer biosynthesis LytR-Cps2A-Psr (LCP) family protein
VTERVCVSCKSGTAGGIIWTSDKNEWIEPGKQHLNGRLALWYSRSRATSDDFSRMRRQRCVVGNLIDQVNPVTMLANYGKLATAVKDNVSVDIPAHDLPAWVELIQRMQQGELRSLPITNKVVDVTDPDFAALRAMVRKATAPAPATSAPSTTATSTPSKSPGSSTSTGTPSSATSTPTTADDSVSSLAAAC